MNGPAWLLTAAVLMVAAMVYRTQQDQQNTDAEFDGTGVDLDDQYAGFLDQYNPFAMVQNSSAQSDLSDANVSAFLGMIRVSEGTATKANPYAVCYGFRHTITDFSDHPAIAEGWGGESLASLGPRYAGLVSTAAGAYQIIKPTWVSCKKALGLTDFGPDSQDEAAVYLIKQAGALDDVQAGRLSAAIAKCSGTWASLPGSTSGQPVQRLATLQRAYTSAGGYLA